jgi:cob(I)alamin adenosyltransferase
MKIYTKTGDNGQTSLVGGTRVSKTELRIEAYGTVDELNSYVGLLRDQEVNNNRKDILKEIQDRLFTIGSILASEPEQTKKRIPDLHESDIELLEKEMDRMDESLEPMRFFILPGGHQSVSFGHLARTVCRRTERIVLRLAQDSEVNELVVKYLNRLSDYLFVLCRMMIKDLNIEEISWKPRV